MPENEIKPDTEKLYKRVSGSCALPINRMEEATAGRRRFMESEAVSTGVFAFCASSRRETPPIPKALDLIPSSSALSIADELMRETWAMTRLREQAKEAEIHQLQTQLELLRSQKKREIASAITSEKNVEILKNVYSKTVIPLEELRSSMVVDDLLLAMAELSRADLIYLRDKSIFITSQGIRIVEKYLLS